MGGCVVRLSNWAAAQLEEGEDQGSKKITCLHCVASRILMHARKLSFSQRRSSQFHTETWLEEASSRVAGGCIYTACMYIIIVARRRHQLNEMLC